LIDELLIGIRHVLFEKCAPLGEVAAHKSDRWCALLPFDFGLTLVWSVGEVAALIPHLAAYLLPLGAPSFDLACALLIVNSTQMYINKSELSHS
jgi:hypothetical protein